MPRSLLGSILEKKDGSIWARVRYKDAGGRRREKRRRVKTRTAAQKKIKELLDEIEDERDCPVDLRVVTFGQLARHYKDTYLVEPKYRGEAKVSGLRAYKNFKYILQALIDELGADRRLASINYDTIRRLRNSRLDTKARAGTEGEKDRSIATVNRELSLLRRIFRVAKRNGWMKNNPFDAGEPLINPSDETHRQRILSYEEEGRLLSVCTGKRKHLQGLLVCALDTGMRRGEILALVWKDIDFEDRTIVVQALNTKTIRRRIVPMTDRLHLELEKLWKSSLQDQRLRVFGIETGFKRAFGSACDKAKVSDFRFHDCRHTAATRLIQGGISLQEVGRLLGHTQAQTTYRYVNVDDSAIRRAAEVLNEIQRSLEPKRRRA